MIMSFKKMSLALALTVIIGNTGAAIAQDYIVTNDIIWNGNIPVYDNIYIYNDGLLTVANANITANGKIHVGSDINGGTNAVGTLVVEGDVTTTGIYGLYTGWGQNATGVSTVGGNITADEVYVGFTESDSVNNGLTSGTLTVTGSITGSVLVGYNLSDQGVASATEGCLTVNGDVISDGIDVGAAYGYDEAASSSTASGKLNIAGDLIINNTYPLGEMKIGGSKGQDGASAKASGTLCVDGDMSVTNQEIHIGFITEATGYNTGTVEAKGQVEVGGDFTSSTGDVFIGYVHENYQGSSIEADGSLSIGGDLISTGSDINVGSLRATSAKLFVDGDLKLDGNALTAVGPANVSVGNVGGIIDGIIRAGQNSRMTIGNNDSGAWIQESLTDIGSGWGTAYTAALGVYKPQKLSGTSGLIVDGSMTDSSQTVNSGDLVFGDKSLFVANIGHDSAESKALVSSDGNINLTIGTSSAGNASIYLANAKAGNFSIISDIDTLKIGTASGVTDISALYSSGNWVDGNMKFSNDLLKGTWSYEDGSLNLKVERNETSVQSSYPKLSNGMAGLVDAVLSDTTSTDNSGVKFVTSLVDNDLMPDHTEAAKVMEGAAQVAVAAGVPSLTTSVASSFAGQVVDHNSLANIQPAFGNEPHAVGLWFSPFYQYSDVDGMSSGKFDNGYEMKYGGAVIGLDYNFNESFRLGLAFHAGGGDSESQGDFYRTENDFNFWGLSLYGNYTYGAFGLTADIGYTGLSSDLDQRIPTALGFGSKLKANGVDSDVLTLGLTGEYRFQPRDIFYITPHLGIRYTRNSTDDATLKAENQRLFKVKTDDQNLVSFPIGIKFSGDIATDGGWTITPSADIGALFTTGDTDLDSRLGIVGTGYSGVTNADVVDKAAFQGALGLEAKANNGLTMSLNYGILASEHQIDHKASALVRYEF
ncbi:hypothetical protein C4J81_01790 [Deltaproteobacteria bacterium Smac51]|nr:hypothetical protein C4J81_01790 [Deltaproteobacteria bacterium Smac51]